MSALRCIGKHREAVGVGGGCVVEIDDDQEVALAAEQISEDAAEVSDPGGVELAVNGDDDGALAAPDNDARKRRRRRSPPEPRR